MELRLLYSNDLHNRPQALERVAALRSQGPALLLDGGDAIGGSNTAFRLSEPIIDRMRALGYRAMAMGNREFHYFRWLQRWREQERGFPLLAANLRDLRQPHGPWLRYLKIYEQGWQVGLIGLTVVQYPVGSPWEKLTGFRFYPPEQSLRRFLPQLSDCDAIILMSHLGLQEDRRIAALFPQLPLILGAHSHDVLHEPERIGQVTLVQGGSHSRFVGELRWQRAQAPRWKLHPV